MDTKKDTVRFINNIVNKEYSEASASLQRMVENKLKDKIKQCLSQEKQPELDK